VARSFARALIEAQEAERRRIARDLHDVVGQMLTAVKLSLEATRERQSDFAWPDVADAIAMVDRALDQVRAFALDLRPAILDDLGLVAAVRWLLSRQARDVGYRATLIADRLVPPKPTEVESACFRVAQEALTNVARHARATQVDITISDVGGELALEVEDNGTGFDVRRAIDAARHGANLGLIGMQERVELVGGRFQIASAPGQGTLVRARFPVTGAGGDPGSLSAP
jgi:signal transduction histidine kinase